jgi:hypothetical protein
MRSPLSYIYFSVLVRCVASFVLQKLETRDNITLAAPIVAVPSEHWEGVDGTWSTFEIRVGTPSQVARVLPATSWQEVWVVWGNVVGVCNTTLGVDANCNDARGGTFVSTSSSTWNQSTQDYLGLNTDLGYSGEGQYGFDVVGLGYDTTEGPTLSHQIVAEIVSDTFWFGQLGLGFQPTNFSGYGDPQASFSDTLYSNGTIASMSWSYTAGAYYQLKGVFGSLIFGGYDASRFTPNDVIFDMTGDNLRDIVPTIRSITSTTASGNTTLMSTAEFAFIDSTVPELWLPADVCEAFEKAFGLTLDNATGLYLVDDTTHTNLLTLNPNITITLANLKTGGPTVDIVLPYGAFDLNVTAPILPNRTSYYFPIRQAASEDEYTIGRMFLQEAYVTADYNSRTFNVSQATFNEDASAQVLAIPSKLPTYPTSSSSPNSTASGGSGSSSSGHHHHSLGGGAIAGIVVGTIVFLFVLALIPFLLLRSRRRGLLAKEKRSSSPVHEIDTGKRIDPKASAYSNQASALTAEVPGHSSKVEIAGNPIMHPQELEADVPIPPGYESSEALNGPSESSRDTGESGVSTMSPIDEEFRGPAELSGGGMRNLERGNDFDDLVSPNSPTMPSMMERSRPGRDESNPQIVVSSPTLSEPSPKTPQKHGSRFEERWS